MAFSLKDYQIAGEIGHGGFATVYRARQKSLSREVAIKCLAPQQTQNEAEIVRFRREAEAMASLKHDNILAVYDYAFYNGNYYIVMEYIDGMPFDKALSNGIPKRAALLVLEKVAGALRYAHAENIIHRDIKPANILLGRNGQVKLADFGLALFQTGIESYSSSTSVLGTISFMAPEALASPKEVDARIDVFSFGCLLYQVCSGTLPFTGNSFGEVSFHLLNDEPAPLADGATSQALAAVTLRCLRKDRENRPAIVDIHNALKETIRDDYHTANEELVSFVRNMPSNPVTDQPQKASVATRPAQKKPMTRRVALIAGILLFALTAALCCLYLFPATPPRTPPLPGLPQINQPPAAGNAELGALSEDSDTALATDGPAPLAGAVPGIDFAHLELKGLTTDDTVFLNGKKRPHENILELAPGHYQLTIKGKSRPAVVKELELLPYARQTVDLRKEGSIHGRK
jgi:serine/threonine protein kinase